MDIARRMEEDYSQRIESLLTPMLGTGRVRAQVVAQIEMSATEEAREQYTPAQPDRAQRADLRRAQPRRRGGRKACRVR